MNTTMADPIAGSAATVHRRGATKTPAATSMRGTYNNQQLSKRSGGNGDGNGNDDSNDDDDGNKGNGTGGSLARARR
jgi:hypothetical protein